MFIITLFVRQVSPAFFGITAEFTCEPVRHLMNFLVELFVLVLRLVIFYQGKNSFKLFFLGFSCFLFSFSLVSFFLLTSFVSLLILLSTFIYYRYFSFNFLFQLYYFPCELHILRLQIFLNLCKQLKCDNKWTFASRLSPLAIKSRLLVVAAIKIPPIGRAKDLPGKISSLKNLPTNLCDKAISHIDKSKIGTKYVKPMTAILKIIQCGY